MHKCANKRFIAGVALAVIVLVVTFTMTLRQRQPWFGSISYDHHQWLTASTLKFSKMWWKEGAVKLKFSMFENPDSVEFQSLKDREYYGSYLAGQIVPFFIIGKLFHREPSPSMLMMYNLLNQFLIGAILALTLYHALKIAGTNRWVALLLATVGAIIEYLLPAPLYWHQNVVGADQLVILPVVLFIMLEIFRRSNSLSKTFVAIAQFFVFLWGMFTDWYFFFVALIVYLHRVYTQVRDKGFNLAEILRKGIIFWSPFFISIISFITATVFFGGWDSILYKFLFRTGISKNGADYAKDFVKSFWLDNFSDNYSHSTVFIALVSFLLIFALAFFYFCASKNTRQKYSKKRGFESLLWLAIFYALPPLLQIYTFRNHSVIHDFSTLKFSPFIAGVPFVLMPALVFAFLPIRKKNKSSVTAKDYILAVIVLFSAIFYLRSLGAKYKTLFPVPKNSFAIEKFVNKNTDYFDVVFSKKYSIPQNPPQQLAFSMKRVYDVDNVCEIWRKVKDINKKNFRVDYLLLNSDTSDEIVASLEKTNIQEIQSKNAKLLKVSGAEFIQSVSPRCKN